jgi:hypothetical protein
MFRFPTRRNDSQLLSMSDGAACTGSDDENSHLVEERSTSGSTGSGSTTTKQRIIYLLKC